MAEKIKSFENEMRMKSDQEIWTRDTVLHAYGKLVKKKVKYAAIQLINSLVSSNM